MNYIKLLLILLILGSCKEKNTAIRIYKNNIKVDTKKAQNYINKNIIIAHRGSTYWTPEETQPAFLWARNIGADYLEFDIQQTKDGKLVAFHDDDLLRTTNLAKIFPDRLKIVINDFTLVELRSLDAGSWFNSKNPKRAKEGFVNLKIMTLRDIVMIAEGYRIKFHNGKRVKEINDNLWTGQYLHELDPNDNGNRPGLYIETKKPTKDVEKLLANQLASLGWNINNNPKIIQTIDGKVAIANSSARVILQSFSVESTLLLEKHLPNIPKCLLLWQPEMVDDIVGNMQKAIDFSLKNNVQSIGTSITGEPNNYNELTNFLYTKMIHDAGLIIHPYTFDSTKQLEEYQNRVDGVFTNRADLALSFYGRNSKEKPNEILASLGYK